MKTAKPRSDAAGFTLIEVMVALVITSLLISVLISSLYYLFRVQDMVRSETTDREADLRVKAWFGDILEHCLPAEQKTHSVFHGNAKELACETTAPLEPRPLPVPLRITLAIVTDSSSGSRLTYAEQGSSSIKPRTLIEWTEANTEVKFSYFDAKGRQIDQWPPPNMDDQVLPSLIALDIRHQGNEQFWLAAPRADGWLIPRPTNPFGITMKAP